MGRESLRTYEFGAFHLDVTERRLLRTGDPVPLTPKMFDLLRVLVENAGHLVEKERLLSEVWPDAFIEEGNLNRGISVLRKALGETSADRYIQTVPKRGYRFIAEVRNHTGGAVPESRRGGDEASADGAPRTRRRPRRLVVAAVILLTVAGVGWLVGNRQGPDATVRWQTAPLHRQLTFTGRALTPTLSSNGARVAYVTDHSGNRHVIVQDVAHGDPVVVFTAPEAGWLRWSPDNSELLFSVRGDGLDGLYLVAVPNGKVRKISDLRLPVACWSPDGKTIAVGSFVDGKILFLDRTGRRQRSISLTGTRDWIWDMDWSPVQERLLVVADDEQRNAAVWTIDPDGSHQRRVFIAGSEILAARWAQQGDAFYYLSRVNQTVSVFKVLIDPVRGDGIDSRVLLSGLETDEGFGLSADGTRFVYARAPYYSNLWITEADHTQSPVRIRRTQLTDGTSVVERPRVSPDGATILFTMGDESRTELYTIPVTGGAPRQLTFMNALSVGGAWSPDGRSIAFASNEGGRMRLWIVNADGSSPRPVAEGEISESYEMAWAPGNRLLYQRAGNRNYIAVDPRNWQQQPFIDTGEMGWVSSASYSPDAMKIAFHWNRGPQGLWTTDSRGSNPSLVRAASRHNEPSPFPFGWSPDGAFVYGIHGKRAAYRGALVPYELTTTEARVMRTPLTGGSPETLFELPFEEIGSVAVLPDGRRFVCTVYSSRSDVWVVENYDTTVRSKRRAN